MRNLNHLKRRSIYKVGIGLSFLFILFITGCKKEETPQPSTTGLYNFSFLKTNNPVLTEDVKFRTIGQEITGSLPYVVNIKNLVASYSHNGDYVTINNEQQQSGVSVNDFSNILTYTVSNSDGTSKSYEVDALWFTGLPMFHINTINEVEIDSKDEYRSGTGIIYGGRNYEDNSGDMKIRGRGHSTWYFHPKKPYQLKFDDKTVVLGMPADKKWIFLSEHSDKTLMRNKLAFEMGYMSTLDWTPASVYAEVFVNNDYRGTYNITQKVEASENRVDLGDDGFLLELDTPDHLDEGDIYFESNYFTIQIKEPETNFESAEFNYIKDYIINFENALYAESFLDPETGYKNYIDIESFVDWYLINEMAKNQDAKDYSSMYCHLVKGQKLNMGPLWDFDLGFGNVDYSECEFPEDFWVKHHAWIERMFDDPEFVSMVKERFDFFRNNQNALLDFIDDTKDYLVYSQKENDDRWDLFGHYIWPNPVVFNSHQEEVNYLKNWFSTRMDWLESEFDKM